MTALYYFLGYVKVKASREDSARLLDLCREKRYPYDGFSSDEYGEISLCFRLKVYRAVSRDCEARGICICEQKHGGLPPFFWKYRARAGMLVGLLLAVLIVISSGFYIWDVRISGNEGLTDSDIENTLTKCGFGIGSPKIGLRTDKLENRVLMEDGRIAWISVNIKGTVAHVKVRESELKPNADAESDDTPANIVAARSGRIERIELSDGNVIVGAGDTVDEGELLVSGLYDSVISGYRWTHAKAKVYARCVREIHVSIPLEYETRVYYGENDGDMAPFYDRSLIFFAHRINFSKNAGKEGILCDTIESVADLSPFSGISLPFSVMTVWYLPYIVETRTRTPEELEELAYLELARELGEIPGGAEIIKKTLTSSLTSTGYHLDCTVVCIEDIAKTVEFEVGESATE